MKVGDYVRTKKGRIAKIIDKKDVSGGLHTKEIVFILDNGNRLSTNSYKVIKSSPNIIDILEVGDYVNGCYVDEILKADECYDDRTHFHLLKFNSYFKNEDIKSIVTKEMYASVEYKVGE